MSISLKKLLVVLMVMAVAVILMSGCTTDPAKKMGIIDLDRVIKESPRAQSYQTQLDKRGAEIQNKYKEIADQKITPEDKQKRQEAALQEFIAAKKELEDKLNAEIETAVKAIAQEKKLDIVFFKQSVRYGGVEITQDVINKLK